MMHIAFLTPEYPHEKIVNAAGIGTSVKNLVGALAKKGITVSVFVYSQNTSETFIENGIKIHLIKHKNYKLLGWYFYRKHLQHYLNKHIVSDKIDFVEAPDWTGITAFMHLKAPLIIRFHGSDAYFCQLENRKQKLKNFWFEKTAISKARRFIAPTSFAGAITAKIFKIDTAKIKTLHYGISLPDFINPQPEVFEQGLILYIGTIIRKKGVLELPEILKKVIEKVPNARLVLIGNDSFDIQTQSHSTWQLMQSQMDDAVKTRAEYLGKVPYQEVRNYIRRANVCVFPTFAETLGMVTIEAMAMQKPVVNSNIGWANEILIDGESGFLVYPQDHQTYADKIITLLEDKNLALAIGKKARKRVEDVFDIEEIVNQNIQFYQSML